jgi:hypothetical protein
MKSSLPPPSPHRRHKGSILLTNRDLLAFSWILEQYAADQEQIRALLGRYAGLGAKETQHISESAARQVLARWLKLGYMEQRNLFKEYPPWVWLSRRAIIELELPYAYYTPHIASLPHLHAINHVRLYLENLHPQDLWTPERALKAARPRYAAGNQPPHTPDAEVRSAANQEVTGIEIELSQKRAEELRRILCDLSTHYSSVWYFALKEPYRALNEALATLGEDVQGKIQLYRLEDIHGYTPITL